MRLLAGIIVGILIVVVIGVAYVLTGSFDPSAAKPPGKLEQWLASFAFERSLVRRAPRVENPRPPSPDLLTEGIAHYRANCLPCHGAPGVEPFEFGQGLNPPAPDLSDPHVQARTDGQLFWIIRHGIRMTGMPAFEPTHGDQDIWSIVAFLRRLPMISPEERQLLESAHEAQEHHHDEGEPSPTETEPHHHAPGSAPHTQPGESHHPPSGTSPSHYHPPEAPSHTHPGESSEDRTSTDRKATDRETRHEYHGGAEEAEAVHPHEVPERTPAEHAGGEAHAHGAQPAGEEAHAHGVHPGASGHAMTALYGDYPMSRESSGTAWQPDLASHDGFHRMRGDWMFLVHGFATAVYDDQGGSRGDEDFFAASMLMGTASRPVGNGVLAFRAMLSGDPATIGKEGYPLLLQTGETADGIEPLIDRQHPHDLFMELAASFALVGNNQSAFLYVGMPGEPALGPPAFMHRFSGSAASLAPISHHWLDSTHITYGVATLGLVKGPVKLEGSLFTGREPDEERVGWDSPEMDSHAFRVSYNPGSAWSLQTSYGRLESPEQLHPEVDTDRTTASLMHQAQLPAGLIQTTIAWGRNRNRPGLTLDMFLAEAAATLGHRHTLFVRAEGGQKNELFSESDPQAEEAFTIGQLSGGYVVDVIALEHMAAGVGGSAGLSFVPDELDAVYGNTPFSGTIFLRAMLR